MPRVSKLPFQGTYHWPAILNFLELRLTSSLEVIENNQYRRQGEAWSATVTYTPTHLLAKVEGPAPPDTLTRLRHLFDTEAPIEKIESHLRPCLPIDQHLGLRLPGCWDPFELVIRAILGQQVSVKGAATLSARLVDRFGPPTPQTLADADVALIGLPGQRATTIRAVAQAILNGLSLDDLATVKGIGPWTAQYVRMRAHHDPDAFPASDLVLMKNSGYLTPQKLTIAAEPWRPYRAYAAMHIWRSGR